jgi:hypothetical protein
MSGLQKIARESAPPSSGCHTEGTFPSRYGAAARRAS